MGKTNRLAGHTLPNEGRVSDGHGNMVNCEGSIRCSCGTESPVLRGTPQRKQWHRDHKDDIREGGDGVVWTGVPDWTIS